MGSIPISALCRVVFKLDRGSFSLLRSLQENRHSVVLGNIEPVQEETPNGFLPVDVLELFTWLERKLNDQVVQGSSSLTPPLESMSIKIYGWWIIKLGC